MHDKRKLYVVINNWWCKFNENLFADHFEKVFDNAHPILGHKGWNGMGYQSERKEFKRI
jgi:hypothetical protein